MPLYLGYGLPRMVKTLLIANVVVFLASMIGPTNAIFRILGLVPDYTLLRFMIWQPLTYQFLHASFGHIFFNLFALWMFGSELENTWGSRDFLTYYLVCGVGGAALVIVTSYLHLGNPLVTTIGASGSVWGLLVGYAMMWPDRMIFIFGVLPMRAMQFVIIFGLIELFSGLGQRGGVAYFAHVGGGVTGFIYLKYGWKIAIWLENLKKRFTERRRFTVIDGGRSRGGTEGGRDTGSRSRTDSPRHPDLDAEIDRILDKIARKGMDSLTDAERKTLDRASNRGR